MCLTRFLVTMPSEPTTTGATYVLMCNFSSNILVLLDLLFLFVYVCDTSISRHSNVNYDVLVLFPVYQYYVRSPGLDFTVRLNGKVPQEFYVSSFDNPVLACAHTIFLRHQVHTVSRLPSSKSWQRCHAGACIAFVPSYCIHTARDPPSRLSHSIFYIKERAAVSRFLF